MPDFEAIPDCLRRHALSSPSHIALIDASASIDYGSLDAAADRVAASLQRDGLAVGDAIAICAAPSNNYVTVFLGALRAGILVAPLASSSTAAQLAGMVADSHARLVFTDGAVAAQLNGNSPAQRVSLHVDDLERWLAPAGNQPAATEIRPGWTFNIIYSSGTTGRPKGIVHSHERRSIQAQRVRTYGYGPDMVLLLATPMYSNATLFALFPALVAGGTVVVMPKFDPEKFLALAERHRATHTLLVPVQYRNLMALPDFGKHDLSSFVCKFCTSAPFAAALKRDVLERWPGGLVEFYGTSEGSGSTTLLAHVHPNKLHTVGQPASGQDIRIIDAQGREVVAGELGEIVGHSNTMAVYHGEHVAGAGDTNWIAPDGRRFLRSGDIGRFDAEGFLEIVDRKKDMIISGGFNVYPSDIEAKLREHPAVAEVAVVGVPSERWGETPVAFVVRRAGNRDDPETIREWVNASVGKTQRLSALRFVNALPRSEVGKVLKRELRDHWHAEDEL